MPQLQVQEQVHRYDSRPPFGSSSSDQRLAEVQAELSKKEKELATIKAMLTRKAEAIGESLQVAADISHTPPPTHTYAQR